MRAQGKPSRCTRLRKKIRVWEATVSRICGAGPKRRELQRQRERERVLQRPTGVSSIESLAKCWACLNKTNYTRPGKEPSKIPGRGIAGAHTELGRVCVPISQSEESTHASGRVLRRVLPQYWGYIGPQLKAALDPA